MKQRKINFLFLPFIFEFDERALKLNYFLGKMLQRRIPFKNCGTFNFACCHVEIDILIMLEIFTEIN